MNFAYTKDTWAHEDMAWANCTEAYELSHNVTLDDRSQWAMDILLDVDSCRMDLMTTWGISPVIYEFGDI